MNTALWIAAGLLAAIYLMSGLGKMFVSREKMLNITHAAGWMRDFSPGAVRAIAVAEILGGIGLTLPALLDIAPVLVPLAATGLAAIMAGAVFTRLRRHEPRLAVLDFIYLAVIAFVAWGRFGPESFSS
jgi:uncharacterized membrane protein YphA (DoxX/SURF4 family)